MIQAEEVVLAFPARSVPADARQGYIQPTIGIGSGKFVDYKGRGPDLSVRYRYNTVNT